MDALTVAELSKSFHQRPAVRGASFSVAKGETVAFLGPNGAGKSTTMRMIAGFLEPDSGNAFINGASILANRTHAQTSLGYLAEGAPLYLDLSVKAFLAFLARTHGLSRATTKDAIARVAEDAGITNVMSNPIETLSKGYRRRVALAGAIVPDPPLLLLDEPTDGPYPNQKILLLALNTRMAPRNAIHNPPPPTDEVRANLSHVGLIDSGASTP